MSMRTRARGSIAALAGLLLVGSAVTAGAASAAAPTEDLQGTVRRAPVLSPSASELAEGRRTAELGTPPGAPAAGTVLAASSTFASMPRCNSTAIRNFGNAGWSYQPSYGGGTNWNCFLSYSLPYNVAVKPLQNSLRYCYGFEDILVDGSFGSRTRDRLKQAQAKEGVAADGSMGPATRAAILWWSWRDGFCYGQG